MNTKKIRMIAADLDGTLLTEKKELTPHTREVIEQAIDRGIIFLPATGRVKAGIPSFLTDIKGLRYLILSNGASVLDLANDQYIYTNRFDTDTSLSLLDELRGYGTFVDYFSEGCGRSEERLLDNLDKYHISEGIKDLIRMSRKPVDDMRQWLIDRQAQVDKFTLFFADTEQRDKIYEDLKKRSDLAVTSSLPNNLEVNRPDCNKGKALIGLGEKLGIDREEIMAFGDGDNDLAMIRMSGMGVAMGNAPEHIRAQADYVTKTNEEEGVAFAVEKIAF